jgi:DNA-directed RNA polymerase specialized sigma24 family protein
MDRSALRSARTVSYKRSGWQRRNEQSFDARQVRVIDFERVLNRLGDAEKTALVLKYRDGETAEAIAAALQCSARKIAYVVKGARQKLAATLDKLDLL